MDMKRELIFFSFASAGLLAWASSAGCGPGDSCEVTATCPVGSVGSGGASATTPAGSGAGSVSSASGGGGGNLLPNGAPCGEGSECASAICTDDVCCDSACDGVCQSCNLVGSEGECTPVPELTDPEDECDTAACDGSGACGVGQLLWGVYFGDAADQVINSVDVDADGNTYVTGTFTGSFQLGADTLTAGGSTDAFIAKIAASGSVVWTNVLGGADEQLGEYVAATSNEVYFTGRYSGSPSIDDDDTIPDENCGWYLVQLDAASGEVNWAQGSVTLCNKKAVDGLDASPSKAVVSWRGHSSNQILQFGPSGSQPASFSGASFGANVTLLANGDVMLGSGFFSRRVAADLSGMLWSVQVGNLTDFVELPDGDIVGVGSFSGTFDQGPTSLTSAGGDDILVIRLSSLGVVEAAVAYGGAGDDTLAAVAFDGTSLLAAGSSDGPLSINGDELSGGGGRDALALKLDPNSLSIVWARRSNTVGDQDVAGIGVDSLGRIYMGGTFDEMLNFGESVVSAGPSDGFVVQLSP